MGGIETEEKCPKCGAPTWFRLTVEGSRKRLDAAPDPSGNVIILTLPDGTVRARCLTGRELPAQQEAFHLHVCNRRTGAPDPNCVVCTRPMPREIAERLGWTDHPACDREYHAEMVRIRIAKRTATQRRKDAA